DGDGKRREEVEEHERQVYGEVPRRAGRGVEEGTDDSVQAPQGKRHGEEAGPAVARRLAPPRPELYARQNQRPSRRETGEAARGGACVRHVAQGGGDQRAEGSDQKIAALNAVIEPKCQTRG